METASYILAFLLVFATLVFGEGCLRYFTDVRSEPWNNEDSRVMKIIIPIWASLSIAVILCGTVPLFCSAILIGCLLTVALFFIGIML